MINKLNDFRTRAIAAAIGVTAISLGVPLAYSASVTDSSHQVLAAQRADTGIASRGDGRIASDELAPLAQAALAAAAPVSATEQFSSYNVSPPRLSEIRLTKEVVLELQRRAERRSLEPSTESEPEVSQAADDVISAIMPDAIGQVVPDEVVDAVLIEALASASDSLQQQVDAAAAKLAALPGKPDTSATGTPTEILLQLATAAQNEAPNLTQWRDAVANYDNGEIPREEMCQLSTFEWHVLRCDAAIQFERLNAAFRAEFGVDIEVTDSFRSLDAQIEAKAEKPKLAAKPGTSNHGWGRAVDVGNDIHNGFDTAQYLWLYENAPLFGWHNPDWARPGGEKLEPWHWEFNGEYAPINIELPTPEIVEPSPEEPSVEPTPTPETPEPEPTPTTPDLPTVDPEVPSTQLPLPAPLPVPELTES